MIRGYGDHAANERTFLAWVRTGISVIAFGIVIERFNIFLAAIAGATQSVDGRRGPIEVPSGHFGRYEGMAMILVGLVLILAAAARFVRTTRWLEDDTPHAASDIRFELVLSASLVLIVAAFGVYLGAG